MLELPPSGAQTSDSCIYTIKQTTVGQSGTAESTRTFVGLKDTRGWRDGPWVRALAALPEDQFSFKPPVTLVSDKPTSSTDPRTHM